MVLAKDLQDIGSSIGELASFRPKGREELDEWYRRANEIRLVIVANPEVSNIMPAEFWHFLSDADIRLKDDRVEKIQIEFISDIVRLLKRGQIP